MATGIILKSTGSWYDVQLEDGTMLKCRLKGKFRQEGRVFTNPVAVGDKVTVEPEPGGEAGMIAVIHERHNYLVRESTRVKHAHHIIAANIDQALLIVTFRHPKLKLGFIDRFLIACESFHIPVIIIFNKIDLLKPAELEALDEVCQLYESIGYQTMRTSAVTGEGMLAFQHLLQGKATLLSGHSGVGKTTLVNTLYPQLNLKTQELSGYSGKGQHTTTFASMHPLPEGGFLIDTPGIKELSPVDLTPEEVSHYLPEMRELLDQCQFNNCLHIDEPGCAVKQALDEGKIPFSRYENYVHIVFDLKDKKSW